MTANKAVKVENSPLKGLVGGGKGEAAPAESKKDFSSFFANMLGSNEEAKSENVEKNAAGSLDVLLSAKGQDQNKKSENDPLKPESALSAEVLQNIENLLMKTEGENTSPADISNKVAKTSSKLEELLNTLKGTQEVEGVEGENENSKMPGTEQDRKSMKSLKSQSPLDFLLKESKNPNVGMQAPEAQIEMASDEKVSKLGLSGEDFIKNAGAAKTVPGENFDPQQLLQKNMNQSMKAYGQKQNLLNNNLIKNTKDLAFKETKSISGIDELKSPDLQIGAQLSSVKEDFIPLVGNKQDNNQNLQTNSQAKVLDLSRIDTSNTNEIIKRISDYIEQSQVASKDSLDLTVKHESLGQFNIQVNRTPGAGSQMMDMQITTNSAEGHEFFMKHEMGLMKNLSQAGIQLSDLKIISAGSESMSFSQGEKGQSGNSQNNGDNAPREFMSFDSGNSSNGSQRRKALWEQAQQNQQRYGA